MGVVSCYPRSAAGGTSRPGGVLWVLGEALAAPTPYYMDSVRAASIACLLRQQTCRFGTSFTASMTYKSV